jgi:hypothetical protein
MRWLLGWVGILLAAAVTIGPASAFKLGSGNEAVIDPDVAHPDETPCTVTLFSGAKFGANNVDFSYQPPAGCKGPWARVVLTVDIGLDAGIQYDRSGTIWLGGVNLWFGTTAEPTPDLAPSWHFERDVTDYTSLLEAANSGFVLIANYTNSTDTSVISAGAKLLFYPATTKYPAPRVPDMIIPLAASGGGTVSLNTGSDSLSETLTLPTNIENAALDVYLQGQSSDEFWYTCVPDALTGPLESCGGGAFREGELSLDGTPAGVAPVYPWIFTGGIDPYLWAPIPGVGTIDFKPFRVELGPFAGLLSNGAAHTLALSVFGADSYFNVTGNLLLYLDAGSKSVTGSVTKNTLNAAPVPVVKVTSSAPSGTLYATVDTSEAREFTISGTAVTSHGKVKTSLTQKTHFSNDQSFASGSAIYKQYITQATTTEVALTTVSGGTTTEALRDYSYPLEVDILETVAADGSGKIETTIDQALSIDKQSLTNGLVTSISSLVDAITPTDTLDFDSSGNITGNSGQKSAASYIETGTALGCFKRLLSAAANVLTSASTTTSCSAAATRP